MCTAPMAALQNACCDGLAMRSRRPPLSNPPTAVSAGPIARALAWSLMFWLLAGVAACGGDGAGRGGDDRAAREPDDGDGPVAAEPGGSSTQGPPPDATGGQSGDPGSGGPSECRGERWDGPGQPWIRARCNPDECECAQQDPSAVDKNANEATGTQANGDARWVAACRAALRDECQIDPDAPVFCGLSGVGVCWPSEHGGWTCECGPGVQHRASADSPCDDALWAECGQRCETAFGSCGEVDRQQFSCLCTGVDGPLPRAPEPVAPSSDGTVPGHAEMDGPTSCAAAMTEYCGDRCETSAGRCAPDGEGFACSCSDGSGGTQSFKELGGISPEACGTALQHTCGAELIAPMTTCTRADAKCEALPRVWAPGAPRPESFEYRCQCKGAPAAMVEARACYRAMLSACPDAIDDDAVLAPAAAGQLGARCMEDGDCAGGICNVGRLGREGVCSAPCALDRDCPAGAVCAFAKRGDASGRCFIECEDEYSCDLLNDAIEDPLYCADPAWLPYGRLLRDDESGQLCAPISDQYWPLPVAR